ncbi:MAG TPA: hypothetical protein VE984_03950 [Gaiellaceae bacterium]|nr:hypothetical protein [Gaiellaceae bacterium]
MRISLALLLVLLVAAAAGCGGGGKKGTTAARTLVGSTSVTLTSTTGGAGGNTQLATAKNCRDLAGLATKIASAVTARSGNPATTLASEAAALQALARAAPPDVRGDFQTFATAFNGFLHALEKAGYKPGAAASHPPSAAQARAITKVARTFDTPKLRRAQQHLSAWAARNCQGVKVGG